MIKIVSISPIDKVYQYLILFLGFLIPLTVAGGKILMSLIVIIWILSGNLKEKYQAVISNKLAFSSIIFYLICFLSILWTENLSEGILVLRKYIDFLLFLPILLIIANRENLNIFLSAFFLSSFSTIILSFLIAIEIIDPFGKATLIDPTIFMSHISFAPLLILCSHFLLQGIVFNTFKRKHNLIALVLFLMTTILIFYSRGRVAHVLFFVSIAITSIQYYGFNLKSLFITLFVSFATFLFFYSVSDNFEKRMHNTLINSFSYFQERQDSNSIGTRLRFTSNTWDVIGNNYIKGVGIGDFTEEYKKVNDINTPGKVNTNNPHNMYLLILAQLGIIGMIFFSRILYFHLILSLKHNNIAAKNYLISILVFYLLMMLSDSYFYGHFTTFFYIYLVSILLSESAFKRK